MKNTLSETIRSRQARVGIVGLGYVGLPLAVEFAKAGYSVVGIDLSTSKVDAVNRGESYIPDVASAEVAPLVKAGRLSATADFSIVKELDTVNICVPTPLRKTKDPDMSYVVSAVEAVAEHVHAGMLVVLESTTYPGTTTEVVQPILEKSGLRAGVDFHLAFSPERVDPGNPKFNTKNTPKIVGGLTPECSSLAQALYSAGIDTVIPVSSPTVAEMVKLLENTFRAVNIGMVNELALMCDRMGIDVWEVVEAARTKPFGFMPFYPGPGLGGHCIPVDPFYLSWKAKQFGFDARFIELAGHINGSMPHFVVTKVQDALNTQRKAVNGSTVLIAGITYKRDIDDMRESPSLDIMHLLHERGANVSYADPWAPELPANAWPGGYDMKSATLDAPTLAAADCVVIVTDHTAFDYDLIVNASRLVIDTRNATRRRAAHVFRLGAPQSEAEPVGA